MELLFANALAEETEEIGGAALGKFSETPEMLWIALGTLSALAVAVLAISRTRRQWNARAVAFGALSVALSFVLSCIRLYRMPQGGSVTPGSMLPLMLFSAAFGVGPGLLTGMAYGLLQYLQGGWFLNIWQFLLDYVLAYAALGLAGLAEHLAKVHRLHNATVNASKKLTALSYRFSQKRGLRSVLAVFLLWLSRLTGMLELHIAMLLAALGRALSATLAGYVFWNTELWPSLVYNGAYLIPDTAVCILLAAVIARPVMKILKTK